MAMKNYCKTQGATDGDIMDVENEVKAMMESVRKLQTTLSEDARVGNIFREETTGEEGIGSRITGEENVEASIEEIEKMDAILRIKAAEERKAKLCRIQAEEESRDILSKLPCMRTSNVIKVNLEEFIRLLNDAEETEGDSLGCESPNRTDGAGDKEKNKDNITGEKKMDNRNGEERKGKHFKFVEKNIQLAKCGRGTLSLTDEEKQRIEELLVEAEDSGGEGVAPHSKGVEGTTKEFYAIDDETKSVLSKIDQQLEAVMKAQSGTSILEKRTKEEDVCEKSEKQNSEKWKAGEKKRGSRLAEINKLLNAVNSVSHEEITPLSEEEIGSLLEQSKRCLDEEGSARRGEGEGRESSQTEGAVWANCKGSEDVISELVTNAKLLMPKFKYRFIDS